MATPIGHCLLGAGIGAVAAHGTRPPLVWFGLLALSGVLADFDLLPGLFVGDVNRWHHQGSHSILAALLWAVIVGVLLRLLASTNPRPLSGAVIAGLAYASHLLLDWLTTDTRAPRGIPLFWPLSNDPYIAPITPIPGVAHGVPGDSLSRVVDAVFSLHNLFGAAVEVAVVAPVLAALWWGRRLLRRH